jgi:hypothetical protein
MTTMEQARFLRPESRLPHGVHLHKLSINFIENPPHAGDKTATVADRVLPKITETASSIIRAKGNAFS